jgi:hypothetical protein
MTNPTRHVINDQDAVPRGGKFVALYKRNGHRAIVNRVGACGVGCFGWLVGRLFEWDVRVGAWTVWRVANKPTNPPQQETWSCAPPPLSRPSSRRPSAPIRWTTCSAATRRRSPRCVVCGWVHAACVLRCITPRPHMPISCFRQCMHAPMQVALGQLDVRKRLPGGPGGLVDLVQSCPIVVEVGACCAMRDAPWLQAAGRQLSATCLSPLTT